MGAIPGGEIMLSKKTTINIVEDLWDDLDDRKGCDMTSIDEEIQKEIKETWYKIIEKNLKGIKLSETVNDSKNSLKNFVQCPDIDCNGELNIKIPKQQPLVTERVIAIKCLRCQNEWEIIATPDLVLIAEEI